MKKSLLRTGMLCLMMLFALIAKAQDITALWDFKNGNPSTLKSLSIEKTTGTVASTIPGIELYVDATNGKLKQRDSDAQFNNGTIIRVPVKSTKDVVTVTSYSTNYTIGGVAADNKTSDHKATSAEVVAGYVDIVATGSEYLYSIQVVQAGTLQEKLLYSTTFTDWTSAKANATEAISVTQNTKYSHETLNFSVFDTQISNYNANSNKFPNWTGGYLMANKSADPYILTSTLSNISKVHFIHGATGSNRGWKLEAKGDGDEDWVVLSSSVANPQTGAEVTVNVNKTNCQLRFTNLNTSQNAYLFQLDIYGNVDMSKTPALGSLEVNGTKYMAADIFNEISDNIQAATIEISKTETAISENNPITNIVADNGEIGTVTYSTKNDTTVVTIPVTANDQTINYVANIVLKPDFILTYYNTDGSVIGTQNVEKDATISTFKYEEKDVIVADGSKFRGWFVHANGSGNRKYTTEETITGNTALYAVATEVETYSTNKRYTFTLNDQYFYAEDHEAFDSKGNGKFHDSTHGWTFSTNDEVKILVGGNAYIIPSLCQYSSGTITISNSKGEVISTLDAKATKDGATASYYYEGTADELTLTFSGSIYLHKLTVANVASAPVAKNEAGYYVVAKGDAGNLLTTIEVANANASNDARTYIFVPKGTYDLGETVLTPISGNNISIIGEDANSTIIVNAPQVKNEGIGTTATFLITGSNTYIQDVTLQNALDYYSSGAAGRAVVIQDKGNRTICKNVKMLSYQDTYYSNADGQYYFEGGEIHGTVDYLCGSGDVFYNKVKLVNESRAKDSKYGEDVIAAPYPGESCKYGYVFDSCTIVNNAASFSLGRSWGGNSKLTYLNTIIEQPSEIKSTRFTPDGMNTVAYQFKEYNSMDTEGNIVTPATNVVYFKKDANTNTHNTTMSADSAALFSIANIFGTWAPDQLAAQVTVSNAKVIGNTLTWDAIENSPAYAVYANGEFIGITNTNSYTIDDDTQKYSVKAANTMGGFGKAVELDSTSTGITNINESATEVASEEYFTADGIQIATPKRGVNIIVKHLANGDTKTSKYIVK